MQARKRNVVFPERRRRGPEEVVGNETQRRDGGVVVDVRRLTPDGRDARAQANRCERLASAAGSRYEEGMIHQREIQLETTGHRQMHDLTGEIARIVSESRVSTGLVHIFTLGSTGAVGTIEFEPGLQKDLPAMLDKLFPPSRDYGHEQAWQDGNGHSHLQATLLGPSLTVPIQDSQLVLGTWQQVFHLECDIKPRRRTIKVTVMGDA
jgi:secondary thiamine-phosphate synthase enzyme